MKYLLVACVVLSGCATKVCDFGSHTAQVSQDMRVGDRCIATNELNYISAIGTVVRP